jgi:hypothetical protein
VFYNDNGNVDRDYEVRMRVECCIGKVWIGRNNQDPSKVDSLG